MKNRNILSAKHKCPICGSSDTIIDASTGETICRECGYVYTDKVLDRGQEWRAFNPQEREDRSRAGAPLTYTMYDKGLSTDIGQGYRDHKGKELDPEQRTRFYRLRKWNRRTKKTSHHRNLSQALKHVSRLEDELGLPKNVAETSSLLYRKVLAENGVKGRTIEGIAAASIYMACRICGVPKNLGDISVAVNISRKNLARNYRYIYKLLDQEVPKISKGKLISKLVNQLGLSGNVEKTSLILLDVVSELRLDSGKSPSGIAAAVLYMGCLISGEKKTQEEIASRGNVTSVTIRNRYKDILENITLECML